MANAYNLFKMDEKVETEGIYLDYGDFRIKIARAGGSNEKFNKIYLARRKPYKRQIDTDTLNEEVAKRLMAEVYADAVILDMDVLDKKKSKTDVPVYVQGIQGPPTANKPDGDVLPFDKKGVVKFLMDLPELFRDIQAQANDIALFRAEDLEKETKNS